VFLSLWGRVGGGVVDPHNPPVVGGGFFVGTPLTSPAISAVLLLPATPSRWPSLVVFFDVLEAMLL